MVQVSSGPEVEPSILGSSGVIGVREPNAAKRAVTVGEVERQCVIYAVRGVDETLLQIARGSSAELELGVRIRRADAHATIKLDAHLLRESTRIIREEGQV